MDVQELATWAAYYGSEHDEQAAMEQRMTRWLGTICWSIFRAAGHKIDLAAFVPEATERQIPGDSKAAERMLMAWVVASGGTIKGGAS